MTVDHPKLASRMVGGNAKLACKSLSSQARTRKKDWVWVGGELVASSTGCHQILEKEIPKKWRKPPMSWRRGEKIRKERNERRLNNRQGARKGSMSTTKYREEIVG